VGKKNSKLTIITGYQCVLNNSGNNSIWVQEKIYMRDRQAKSSPHPRKQFIKDLIAFINAKRTMNHEIIVNLDANEVLGEESQGMAKLMRECDQVDLLDKPELDPEYQLKDKGGETINKSTLCWERNGYRHVLDTAEPSNTMMVLCQTIEDYTLI
jgi:hypothetical protein